MIGWLLHVLGLDDASGAWYLFWSGIGSDLGELTLITGGVIFYRRHTCHVDHCWRLARHEHAQDGTTYQLCRKHHPHVQQKLTATDVRTPPPA